MKLLKQIPGRCHFTAMSHNGKTLVLVCSMNIKIYDLEQDCFTNTLEIKYGSHVVFTEDDKLLIIKTTESRLAVYDLLAREFVFKKKIGKNDGYNIALIDNKKIATGDWENCNIILDLTTLELKNFQIEGLGMGKFLTNYEDKYLICHCPENEDYVDETREIMGVICQAEDYYSNTVVSLFDNQFNILETLFNLDDDNTFALGFNFAGNKLFYAKLNVLRVIDIKTQAEESFYFDSIIMYTSISKSGKYIFAGNLMTGCLLNERLEKVCDFENSNQMTGLSATFSDDESKIIINSNGKISIYMI